MEIKNLIFVVVLLAVVISIVILLVPQVAYAPKQIQESNLSLQVFGRVSDIGYITYNVQGNGKITLLALKEKPTRKILVLKDSGIGMESFDDFAARFYDLDKFGYETSIIGPFADIKDGIVIIPTGAMPASFISRISEINRPIIYIGSKDMVIRNGIKKQAWYAGLSEMDKAKITVIEGTLDELLENNKNAVDNLIIKVKENGWIATNKKTIELVNANWNDTKTIEMKGANYLRVIWDNGEKGAIYDSQPLAGHELFVNVTPETFPLEKTAVAFELEKSNGTVYIVMEKNGKEMKTDKWQRITEDNLFIRSYALSEPGTYILKVKDNSGVIGGSATHVKDLRIEFEKATGYEHTFSAVIDGVPIKNGIVTASLDNSTKTQQYYVMNGKFVISALLTDNKGTFHFTILGVKKDVTVENISEEISDFYIRYGPPGILIVFVVYLVARFLKRPTYTLRVGDWSGKIRTDVRISSNDATGAFRKSRSELGIAGPITAREYVIGLKRHVTEGAEITEGNIEQILKQLCKKGVLESYGGFYQITGEGNVQRNVLKRIIRDALIKKGVQFKVVGERFITEHYEIGFFGSHFEKKAFVVFDDEVEIRRTLAKLNERERAKLSLQQMNNSIELITKYGLDDVL